MKVCKVGGWSVGDINKIRQVARILNSDEERKALVSSVPKGITDSIYNIATSGMHLKDEGIKPEESVAKIKKIYLNDIADHAPEGTIDRTSLEKSIRSNMQKLRIGNTYDEKAMGLAHYLLGEPFFCKEILEPLLKKMAHRPISYMDTIGKFIVSEGEIGKQEKRDKTYRALSGIKDSNETFIIPGFVGSDENNNPLTIKRGGSDTFGAVVAAANTADLYENFTNQDGVRAVDPTVIPDADFIDALTYREYSALAYRNFNVLDFSVIPYLEEAMVPTRVLNHDNPGGKGTLVLNYKISREPVTAIANVNSYCSIGLYNPTAGNTIGYQHSLTGILLEHEISFDHSPSEYDYISFFFSEKQIDDLKLNRLLRDFRDKAAIRQENMVYKNLLSLIAIVGKDMENVIGLSERAARAFRRAGVNIIGKDQGASQYAMVYFIDAGKEREAEFNAVKEQYNEFFSR